MLSMGCLKLTYQNLETPLKVVYKKLCFNENTVQLWLSVDPLSDEYPSMSPYMYCAGNPIMLVDPDGQKVEYNSFRDKIYVNIARAFSSEFRSNFNDLKKSKETYVFKSNNNSFDEFTTNGDELFINFSTNKKTSQGDNWFNNLKHESEHGMQFEYGEVGFDNKGRTTAINIPDGHGSKSSQISIGNKSDWNSSATNFDLNDEVNARDAGYHLSIDPGGNYDKNVKKSWQDPIQTRSAKIQHLQNSNSYGHLPVGPINNRNTVRVKTSTQYMLPYRRR